MNVFDSSRTKDAKGATTNVNISPVNVTQEQDTAKKVLDILAPVFGATLPIKFAIQASIMKTDNEKLRQALTDVKILLIKEL